MRALYRARRAWAAITHSRPQRQLSPGHMASNKLNTMNVALERHPVPPGINPRRVVRSALLQIVPWLFGVACFTYVDRSNLAFASLTLKADLHLSNTSYGLGAAIFFAAYCAAQLPATWVIVRYGAPVPLALMVIAWGAVSAGTSGINSTSSFYLVRFLLGLCEAGTFPGSWHHLSCFFNTFELGVGYTAVASATALSQVIGAPLAAALLLMDGVGGRRGWTWLFLIEGLITILFGVAVYVFLPRRPAALRQLQPAERAWLQDRHDHADRHARSKTTSAGHFWEGMVSWRLWYLGVCWFLVETAIYGILFWTPLLLEALLTHNFDGTHPTTHTTNSKALALANAKIALLSTAIFAPAAAGMIGNAFLSKHFKERNFHGGVPVLVSGIAFLALPSAISHGGVAGGFVTLIIAATGAWAVHPPLWSWPASFLVGPAKSAGIACFNACGTAGGFVGPYLIGYLSDRYGGFPVPMYLLGSFNVLAAVLVMAFRAPNLTQEHLEEEEGAATCDPKAAPPYGV